MAGLSSGEGGMLKATTGEGLLGVEGPRPPAMTMLLGVGEEGRMGRRMSPPSCSERAEGGIAMCQRAVTNLVKSPPTFPNSTIRAGNEPN